MGRLHLAHDARIDALDVLDLPFCQCVGALGAERTDALDRPRHAGRDFAGLLGADGFGELRPGVRERAQSVPALDDVPGAAGDLVQGVAQFGGRRLQLQRLEVKPNFFKINNLRVISRHVVVQQECI